MHEIDFADAICPKPAIVLGLDLLPFTIGHELLLWQRRNPIVLYANAAFDELPDGEKGKALSQCVLLCCRKTPKGWRNRRWLRSLDQMDLKAEILKFREYHEAGSRDLPTKPQPRVSNAPFHYFGGPELGRLINFVSRHHMAMIKTHFEGSPLNFPLGLARQLYLIDMESDGNVWIKNYNDLRDEQRVLALEEKEKRDGPGLAIGAEAVKEMARRWNAEHPDAPVPEE